MKYWKNLCKQLPYSIYEGMDVRSLVTYPSIYLIPLFEVSIFFGRDRACAIVMQCFYVLPPFYLFGQLYLLVRSSCN